jgi:hypothetical protein
MRLWCIITIYAPMIYTAPRVMFLMQADTLRGQVGGGWALEMESFLGPVKWHRADRRVPFRPKKLPTTSPPYFSYPHLHSTSLSTIYSTPVHIHFPTDFNLHLSPHLHIHPSLHLPPYVIAHIHLPFPSPTLLRPTSPYDLIPSSHLLSPFPSPSPFSFPSHSYSLFPVLIQTKQYYPPPLLERHHSRKES